MTINQAAPNEKVLGKGFAPQEEIWKTAKQMARRYNVSERTIWNWVADHILPCQKCGHVTRFLPAECDIAWSAFRRGSTFDALIEEKCGLPTERLPEQGAEPAAEAPILTQAEDPQCRPLARGKRRPKMVAKGNSSAKKRRSLGTQDGQDEKSLQSMQQPLGLKKNSNTHKNRSDKTEFAYAHLTQSNKRKGKSTSVYRARRKRRRNTSQNSRGDFGLGGQMTDFGTLFPIPRCNIPQYSRGFLNPVTSRNCFMSEFLDSAPITPKTPITSGRSSHLLRSSNHFFTVNEDSAPNTKTSCYEAVIKMKSTTENSSKYGNTQN
jgi:hypothetical protein